MKVLIITNLFPNREEPNRGGWNCRQFVELAKYHTIQVVAPIAWFPLVNRAKRIGIPIRDKFQGLEVYYPRYFYTPKIGRSLYGVWFFLSLFIPITAICRTFRPEIILASWAFPDGFGSWLLARLLRIPLVVKVHGSDINESTKFYWRRKMVTLTLKNAARVISVCHDLKTKINGLGVPADKVTVVFKGVDRNLFKLLDRDQCRRSVNVPNGEKVIIYIGHLRRVKGPHILLESFDGLLSQGRDDVLLVIIGEGDLKASLEAKLRSFAAPSNAIIKGPVPHEEIPIWMNAADVLCLPSLSEGFPSVILEALACGLPIVATEVGDVPRVLSASPSRWLVPPGSPARLKEALAEALNHKVNRQQIRAWSEGFSWEGSGKLLAEELEKVANESPSIKAKGKPISIDRLMPAARRKGRH